MGKTLGMLKSNNLSAQPALHDRYTTSTCIARFDSELDRDLAENVLAANGIETRRWWGDGLDQMPAFSSCRSLGNLDDTRMVSCTTLGIPFFRDLDSRSLEAINSCLS